MEHLQNFVLIPVLSLLPCVIWLVYFFIQSRYKTPPLRLIFLTFLLGALATIPALALNLIGQQLFYAFAGNTSISQILVLFIVVGPVEEAIKMLMVWIYAYRQPEFDEPLDGVIYSAAAALGFAAVENIVYLTENNAMLVLLRGPLSNPGHALFSAVWGLALCRAKLVPNLPSLRLPILVQGWLVASLLHSIFDALLVGATKITLVFFAVLVGLMVALFFWVRSKIKFHAETSPHREGTLLMPTRRYCQECGARGKAGMPCQRCGSIIPDPDELQLCPVCNEAQRPGAKFCMRCGANIRIPARENLDLRPHFVTITNDGDERIAFILNREEIFVGRTLNNAFVIEHPSVSKRHARITVNGDEAYALVDLGSSNGTYVNGKRISEAQLEDGYEVRFGRANFVYRAQRANANGNVPT
jgi:RsiW-degrading membrane proteinase PrsW (M82 family)